MNLHVMLKDTLSCAVASITSNSVVPCYFGDRVVGAMKVVVVDTGALEVIVSGGGRLGLI